MFRPRSGRRSPFADFIDWTDYHFTGDQGPIGSRRQAPWAGAQWNQRRRTHPLLRILLFLAIAFVISRLIRGRRRHSSWF